METKPNKNQKKIKRLYSIMFFILDVENALWSIADIIIRPVKLLRGVFVYKIKKIIDSEEIKNNN